MRRARASGSRNNRSRGRLAGSLCAVAVLLATGTARADTATYDEVPGSAASAAYWAQITAGLDLPDVQMRGTLQHGALSLVAANLGHVPLAVVRRADAFPARSWLFAGRLTDLPGFTALRGLRPPGWPEGMTWDTVPGAGRGAPGGGMVMNPDAEGPRTGESAFSLALHEYAHTLDVVLATGEPWKVSATAAWTEGPYAELRSAGASGWFAANAAYLLGNASEWWAEAADLYLATPATNGFLAGTYPQTWQFLRDLLGEPRFLRATATAPATGRRVRIAWRATSGYVQRARVGAGRWRADPGTRGVIATTTPRCGRRTLTVQLHDGSRMPPVALRTAVRVRC